MALTIGVDVGGTKISAVLVNEQGKVLKESRLATEARKPKKIVLRNIATAINDLKTKEVKRVGVSIAGAVDKDGKLSAGPNLPSLKGCFIRKELEKLVHRGVVVDNDANCFALAEHHFGAAKGKRHVLGLIIGTGIGVGVIINNKVYHGATGSAGEFGHIYFPYEKRYEEYEQLVSGKNVELEYQALTKNATKLKDFYSSNDEVAIRLRNQIHTYAGLLLANMINSYNPEMIVIGGGVSNLPFYEAITAEAKKHAIPKAFEACQIVKNQLGDNSGRVGAAVLAMQ